MVPTRLSGQRALLFPGQLAPGTAAPLAAADANTQARMTTTREQPPLLFIEMETVLYLSVILFPEGYKVK